MTKTLERELLKGPLLVQAVALLTFFVMKKVKHLRNSEAMHSQLFSKGFS